MRPRGVLVAGAVVVVLGLVAVLTFGRPFAARAYHRLADRQPAMVPDGLDPAATTVLYLHHSTGLAVWDGGVPRLVERRNAAEGTDLQVVERAFPHRPYPWDNNPYDYWNAWVNHSGDRRVQGQATLEDLVGAYDVIVWKDCFLAGDMVPDDGRPDVTSPVRTPANYRLQYLALRDAMHRFPGTRFVVWTLPPKVATDTDPATAELARQFASWVREEWDQPGDNVFLWDYRAIAAPDDLYLPAAWAVGERDSHPGTELSQRAAALFVQRLVDVAAGRGDRTPATGATL
ncbi:hypothetical protein [Cellulomonas sp. 73-92]|uniref:hypothetical protein n=1 Tax=Cellulomonas sp. 73-92 TaxID=1895740 RepID=UPI000B1D31F1|nr:hypothetical protein [Cellulomonas sp. 73-92]